MTFRSVLVLALAVTAFVALMTIIAVPHSSSNIAAVTDNSIYRPVLWKVY
jgi:hypothetical protein